MRRLPYIFLLFFICAGGAGTIPAAHAASDGNAKSDKNQDDKKVPVAGKTLTTTSIYGFKIDLNNFVGDVFKVAQQQQNAYQAPPPPPLTTLQLRQQQLINAGHPFTRDAFLNTAKAGDVRLLVQYMAAGMDVNVADSAGQTALMFAVMGQQLESVQALIAYHANVNQVSNSGDTPLLKAVENNDPLLTAFLLQAGADPNATNLLGLAPLHAAAQNGYPYIVALLASRGGNINTISRTGLTPLQVAIRYSHDKVALLLMKMGANLQTPDNNGNNALLAAVLYGRYRLVDYMLDKGADPNAHNALGLSALDLALNNHDMATANLLYAAGAKPPGLQLPNGPVINPPRR